MKKLFKTTTNRRQYKISWMQHLEDLWISHYGWNKSFRGNRRTWKYYRQKQWR